MSLSSSLVGGRGEGASAGGCAPADPVQSTFCSEICNNLEPTGRSVSLRRQGALDQPLSTSALASSALGATWRVTTCLYSEMRGGKRSPLAWRPTVARLAAARDLAEEGSSAERAALNQGSWAAAAQTAAAASLSQRRAGYSVSSPV